MKNAKTVSQKGKKMRIGITWKMFAILICVVSLFAIAAWALQARTVNIFYQVAKFDEFEKSAEDLSESFGNDLKTSEISAAYADEYYNDIWVYRVKGGAIDTEAPIAYAYGVNDSYVEML